MSASPFASDVDMWQGINGVACTLGTTRAKAGSNAVFRAVDVDLQLAVARHARTHGAKCFALTSSLGANPHSRFPYLRTKGELENAVRDLDWPSLTIVRPGPILGERDETRTGERILEMALKTLAPVLPKRMRGNPAGRIARSLLEAAIGAPDGFRLVEAAEIG